VVVLFFVKKVVMIDNVNSFKCFGDVDPDITISFFFKNLAEKRRWDERNVFITTLHTDIFFGIM
jgi:hypothetical protein